MQLEFLGANRQVTGSSYLLTIEGRRRVLIDCGMFQERDHLRRNWDGFAFDPAEIDAVLLTHAHLDHCGLLPKLVRHGYRGPIYTHHASRELAHLVMADSARIQQEDVRYKQQRHEKTSRKSPHPYRTLYGEDDARRAFRQTKGLGYMTPLRLGDDAEVMFHDAGHILGSALLQVSVTEHGRTLKLVFSGDLGQDDKPILRDPQTLRHADVVVMESTYGNRDHDPPADPQHTEAELSRIVTETYERGGRVVIPVFAIERAQEMLYHFARLRERKQMPRLPVFLDSPMAIKATGVFDDYPMVLDDDAAAVLASGQELYEFPDLYLTRSQHQSIAINSITRPCVIMAGSGMCTGGRIKHHLKRALPDPNSTVLFTGYQAVGTLGRHIAEGEPSVRIHGKWRDVRCRIDKLDGMSGHADRGGLLDWFDAFDPPPKRLLLTHGDAEAAEALAATIRDRVGDATEVSVPGFGEVVEL